MSGRNSLYRVIADCFTLLLAQHLADVSCFKGPSMPSGSSGPLSDLCVSEHWRWISMCEAVKCVNNFPLKRKLASWSIIWYLVNIVVKFWKFMIDFWVTYDYVTEVFHVNKSSEWPLLWQMKVCLFQCVKDIYDISMNNTDSFFATHILLIPQPLLIRNVFLYN